MINEYNCRYSLASLSAWRQVNVAAQFSAITPRRISSEANLRTSWLSIALCIERCVAYDSESEVLNGQH